MNNTTQILIAARMLANRTSFTHPNVAIWQATRILSEVTNRNAMQVFAAMIRPEIEDEGSPVADDKVAIEFWVDQMNPSKETIVEMFDRSIRAMPKHSALSF